MTLAVEYRDDDISLVDDSTKEVLANFVSFEAMKKFVKINGATIMFAREVGRSEIG